ncbi:MAG: hypothetical protein Phog2KO_50060 [Phototrophicaceae bacterium]
MLNKFFPQQDIHEYKGNQIAKWVFAILTIITIIRSLIHIFASDGGAQSIATIPLDTFTVNGGATVILIFAYWGLSQLILGIFYGIVLLRYQALIPLMYLSIIVEYVVRVVIALAKPIETVGTAPGEIANYIIPPLAIVMLFLSLRHTNKS